MVLSFPTLNVSFEVLPEPDCRRVAFKLNSYYLDNFSSIWKEFESEKNYFTDLKKEMATHSSVLAWRIPGMEEPGGLPSLGSHRAGHDWSDLAAAAVLFISISLASKCQQWHQTCALLHICAQHGTLSLDFLALSIRHRLSLTHLDISVWYLAFHREIALSLKPSLPLPYKV